MLGQIEERFGRVLEQVEWVSLGGAFLSPARVIRLIRSARAQQFCERYGVQVYWS